MTRNAHRTCLTALAAALVVGLSGCGGPPPPPPKPGTVDVLSYSLFGELKVSGDAWLDSEENPVAMLQVHCAGKCRIGGATLEHNSGRGGKFRLRARRAGHRRAGDLQRYALRFAPGEKARLYRTFAALGRDFNGDGTLHGVEMTVTGPDLHPHTQGFDAGIHRLGGND